MILSSRNYFLQITIFLTIASFSEEFFVPTNQKNVQAGQELKQNAPKEEIYYHRNDIGHLGEYYQERNKLRKENNAIQKALDEPTLKNETDTERRNSDSYRIMERSDLLDSFPIERQDQNLNETLSDENSIVITEMQNNLIYSQNNTQVKLGECGGHIIYIQNILITGANYRATNGYLLEINLEGLCITCLEIKSKNNKEVKIKVISGGPGKPNISLNFEELNKDFDFAYLLKVWGVGERCT